MSKILVQHTFSLALQFYVFFLNTRLFKNLQKIKYFKFLQQQDLQMTFNSGIRKDIP